MKGLENGNLRKLIGFGPRPPPLLSKFDEFSEVPIL